MGTEHGEPAGAAGLRSRVQGIRGVLLGARRGRQRRRAPPPRLMPLLHLLAGPNGAGKSSYVRDILAPATHLPFINADEIAASRWPDAQAAHAYEAAQMAEVQRRELIAAGTSFISETVFSHPSKIQLVSHASDAGYLVHLHVVMVPVELSVQRVLERVRRGGHDVPEQKIRERYERLW